MTFMSPTGRHITAAEALTLGIVDQVTDQNTVDAAVKFALSVAGETQKTPQKAEGAHWYKIHSLFTGLKINSVNGREIPPRAVILGKSNIKKCRHVGCGSQRKQKTRQADSPPQKP